MNECNFQSHNGFQESDAQTCKLTGDLRKGPQNTCKVPGEEEEGFMLLLDMGVRTIFHLIYRIKKYREFVVVVVVCLLSFGMQFRAVINMKGLGCGSISQGGGI